MMPVPCMRDIAGVLQLRSIRRSALQDKDTGLGNTEQLTIDIRRMEPEGDHFFLLIDIQGYREINRAYSRKSGDRILMALSDRIASHAALHGANAYRLNGVEFGVLLTSKPGNLKSIMTNLRILLENPVLIEDQRSVLTSSIGATRVEAGEKPGAVLERADKALNRAERTFERCAVYDDVMAADIDSGEALAQQLKEAIAQGSRGGLELSYQGKLDLRTGKLVGCEALLSWPGRPGGALSGEETAVVAEQHGLMKLLTGWVARQAISQASNFKALGFELPIAINLSAYSVLDEELGVHLQELLEEFAVEPADLELEISEVQLLSDPLRIGPVVRDLVDRGFRLDVNDFGLGAAAVRYLDQLPINVVKISQNIIAQCRDSLISREVLASSLRVIRQLGLKSLAVGVEEPEVVELLQTLNCDMAQVGAFSHAMNPGQFIEWVTRLK